MSDNTDSVYVLVTKLCMKLLTKQQEDVEVQKLRNTAYELLLFYRQDREDSDSFIWKDHNDYYNEFLAWQYILQKSYGLRKLANKIDKCIASIQCSDVHEDSLKSIFHLLLKLKHFPQEYTCTYEDVNSELQDYPFFRIFDQSEFGMKGHLFNRFNQFSNDSFSLSSNSLNSYASKGQKQKLKTIDFLRPNTCDDISESKSDFGFNEFISNFGKSKSKLNHVFKKQNTAKSISTPQLEFDSDITDFELSDCENSFSVSSLGTVGYKSLKHPQTEIWENLPIAFIESRTWEWCGFTSSNESPFFSESHVQNLTMLDKIRMNKHSCIAPDDVQNMEMLSHQDFKNDVICVVVGLESKTFILKEGNIFVRNPHVVLEGMAFKTFVEYCELMINCAICYKALLDMCTVCAEEQSSTKGYIYTEFCNAVNHYLFYYRLSVLNYGEKQGLLQFHSKMRKLSFHLFTIASVCKVGTYKDIHEECPPNCVQLLNYLYSHGLKQASVDVKLVIYSVFIPCVQNYFMRFLHPWLLEGVLNDPFNEFFIHSTHKYIEHRNRSYWTRAFIICDDMVPKFLFNFAHDIYTCGKAMNMLKLCVPKSIVCYKLERKNYHLINCCATNRELTKLKQWVKYYELDILSSGGTPFSIRKMFLMKEKEQLMFSQQVAVKRATSLNAIQEKRMDKLKQITDTKCKRIKAVRAELDKMVAIKKEQIIKDLAKELQEEEALTKREDAQNKMIKEEADILKAYYRLLTNNADALNENITTHVNPLKGIVSNKEELPHQIKYLQSTTVDEINANTNDVNEDKFDNYKHQEINSNITKEAKPKPIIKSAPRNENRLKEKVTAPQLTDAQRNKLKVMGTSDMDVIPRMPRSISALSDEAMKNKTKVMSSEFFMPMINKTEIHTVDDHNYKSISRSSSVQSINTNDNYLDAFFENLNSEESNTQNNNIPQSPNTSRVNYDVLFLSSYMRGYGSPSYVETINEKLLNLPPHNRLRKLRQMRTCNTEVAYMYANMPESPSVFSPYMQMPRFSVSKAELLRPVGLSFPETPTDENQIPNDRDSKSTNIVRVLSDEISILDHYISDSIMTPLYPHMSLVKNEILKHFIVDLQYLNHLETLRNYYFLLDGEYSRNLIEGLLRNMYNARDPKDVLNVRSLLSIFNAALHPMYDRRGFNLRIDKLPKTLDLGSIHMCDCLTLTFKVKWPLNVLLPPDTIKRYDEVFKFLLKIHRITWVLKNIFMDMKVLNKQCGRRSVLLTISMQYNKLQLWRHMMTHFIQTFQNYIVGEVLQSGWAELQTSLADIETLNELYTAHATYIKQIHFLCLLNQKSAPLRNAVINIFIVILKYYEYFRSREWTFNNSEFEHPNYDKLEEIFKNFMSLVKYFFRAGQKVIRVGSQPQFSQLIDLLNINNFYSNHFNTK